MLGTPRDSERLSAVGPEKQPAQIEHDLAASDAWPLVAVSALVLGAALFSLDFPIVGEYARWR